VDESQGDVVRKPAEQLKEILDRAILGDHPAALHGFYKGDLTGSELIARLAYISAIERAIQIITEYELGREREHGNS
jgi:hypothetical protein